MSEPSLTAIDAHAEALSWHEKLSANDAAERTHAAFQAWRAASPVHAQAYDEVASLWNVSQRAAETPAFLAIRHQTLTRVVVSRRTRRPAAMAAAALFAIGTASLAYFAIQQSREAGETVAVAKELHYQAGVGERLTIELADGSTVMLNTASRLRVDYSKNARHLFLESGEAFFNVAKDQERPFVVTAGDRSITAHGTQFDVRVAADHLQVGLLEGRVSVRHETEPNASEIHLQPNEMLVADREQTSVQSLVDIERLTGWRDGFVYFDNDTLADAAAEMNRYVTQPRIEVEPTAAAVKLSGVFRTGQVATFVDALEQGFPIVAAERSSKRIVLQYRASARTGHSP